MRSFIDLRGTAVSKRFAIWCERGQRFLTFNGRWAWNTMGEFESDLLAAAARHRWGTEEILPPFRALAPDWLKGRLEVVEQEKERA